MFRFILTAALSAATVSALNCSASSFSGLLPSNAFVNYTASIPANGTWGDSNPAFPTNATSLPELCVVSVHVTSSNSSSFNYAIFLPEASAWNGRFFTTGNGGLSGGINWVPMGAFTQYGAAAMSTDTGHLSASGDGTWAYNNPEGVIDWGYRALHESVVQSKTLIAAYYGQNISQNYYAACSTGGRQGLKEIQMFPEDFEGIAIGAPAWWFTRLPAATVQIGKVNLPANASYSIPTSMFPVIAEEMVRQCDPQDGVTDGIVQDPYGCNFYPEALLCRPDSNSSTCLTRPQFETLRKIYTDYVDTNQTLVFPGLAIGADATYLSGDFTGTPATVGLSWIQNAIYNDPTWPWQSYDFSTVQLLDALDPGNATADSFDLSAFRNRGGKIIMYHGAADNLIPTGSSVYYYQQVVQTMTGAAGVDVDDFFKFYLIPGMAHCTGSGTGTESAPYYIGAAYQTVTGATHGVPGYEDAKHDVLLALQEWVENGTEPQEIVATKFVNDTVADGVEVQRPLCAYPLQAKYSGTGDVSVADSWSCESLY